MNENLMDDRRTQTMLDETDSAARHRYAWRTSLIFGLAALGLFVFSLVDALPIPNWMSGVTLAATLVIALAGLTAALLNRKSYRPGAIQALLFVLWLGSLVIVFMTSGLGIVLAAMVFTLSISITIQALPVRSSNFFILMSMGVSVAVFLAEVFVPYARDIVSPDVLSVLPWVVAVVTLIFGVFLVQRFGQFPLLMKIVVPFLAMLLLVIGLLAAINYFTVRASLVEAANEKLRSAALQTGGQVDAFFAGIDGRLAVEVSLPDFVAYISLDERRRPGSPEEAAAQSLLFSLQERGADLSYSIFNPSGQVILTTLETDPLKRSQMPQSLGIEQADRAFLQMAMNAGTGYSSPVLYLQNNQPVIYFVRSILNRSGVASGALVVEVDLRRLQTGIFEPAAGLAGASSYPILFSEIGLRLASGLGVDELDRLAAPLKDSEMENLVTIHRLPDLPLADLSSNDQVLDAELTSLNLQIAAHAPQVNGKQAPVSRAFEIGKAGVDPVVNAVAVPISSMQGWKVIFMQDQQVLLAPVTDNLRRTSLLIFVIILASVVLSSIIARAITRPVEYLTASTQKVLAGDLTTQVAVKTSDEIGLLGRVFNQMTAQLNQTLGGLEQRVVERTAELAQANRQTQKRADQLETIADIARAVATERDPEKLLPLITRTISERFGFYHVGIFLLDSKREFALLQAANSEGGQRMLARGHRLAVGQQGIVGYATARGVPRVALDVGQDAVFFNNPDLPRTRSEMALPLKLGDQTIGALDVQSTEPAAFGDDDVAVLTILADQVTTAIENARLFQSTRQALDELQAVQRQYLREKWIGRTDSRANTGFVFEQGRVRPLTNARLEAENQAPAAGLEETGPNGTVSVPIYLRGEVIGEIDLQKELGQAPGKTWTDEEKRLVEAVAEQVGLALENARLIEETQQRAERESLVAQITNRLRTSNDPQTILQTAVVELKRALQVHTAHVVVPGQSRAEPPASAPVPADSGDGNNANGKDEAL